MNGVRCFYPKINQMLNPLMATISVAQDKWTQVIVELVGYC